MSQQQNMSKSTASKKTPRAPTHPQPPRRANLSKEVWEFIAQKEKSKESIGIFEQTQRQVNIEHDIAHQRGHQTYAAKVV